ncbi:MAG: hypothetical protein NC078_06250 [Ruminococcus sp.]|nr:hypothetical protein [Ruminococcus sp.]
MMWLHVVLDGIAMGAVFALTLCTVSSVDPRAFTKMYPLGLRKIAPPIPEKSVRTKKKMLWILWSFTVIFGILSNLFSGVKGFGQLFLAGYIQMFIVDMADLIGWNIIFREKMGKRLELPGTEGSELYSRKNWLLKLGIPNHFGIWLLAVCPLNGLIDAVVISLLNG